MHRVTRGPIELLLRRKSEDQVEVWPLLCPHEGGLIDEKHLCDGQVVCPWHGLCASEQSRSETGDATPGVICRGRSDLREIIWKLPKHPPHRHRHTCPNGDLNRG